MEVLELSKRGGRQGVAAGEWTCDLDGGLTLNPGDTLQVLRSYVHIPGSSASQTSIVVVKELSATCKFCYGASYISETMLDSFKNFYLWRGTSSGADKDVGGRELYFRNKVSGALVIDEFTLTLPVGNYTPGDIAKLLTNQLQSSKAGLRLDEKGTSGLPDYNFQPHQNTPTYRSLFVESLAEDAFNDGTAPNAGAQCHLAFTPAQTDYLYYIGCEAAAIVWNETDSRFTVRFHTLPKSGGAPGILRGDFGERPADQGFNTITTHQFIGITDFGVSEQDWDTSLWALLGFSWADLGERAAASETGLTTRNLATNGIYSASNDKVNMGAVLVKGLSNTFIAVTDEIDQSDAPLASNGPSIAETSGGYWRIETSLLSNTWRKGDGTTAPQALAVADRSYASGDLYVGQPGPAVEFRSTLPQSFTSVTCRIVDPATDTIEDSAGDESTIVIAIARAPPAQPSKQ